MELTLSLETPVAGGATLARTPEGVVFVTGGIPGEVVQVRVTEVKKSYRRAQVTRVLEASEHRVEDRRDTWGAPEVGGIEYAHVDTEYSRQLKLTATRDQLVRLGGFPKSGDGAGWGVDDLGLVAPPGDATRWRTRVQLAVYNGRVGMLAARSRTVVPVTHVPLAVDAINALGLDQVDFTGATRVEVAVGDSTGAVTVVGAPQSTMAEVVPAGWSCSVRADGHRNRRGRHGEGSVRLVTGSGRVAHRVRGVDFELDGQGFWQVHPAAADLLSAQVVARIAGAQTVVDLYCGAGLFSLMCAVETGARVYGVEGSAQAIADARANAARVEGSAGQVTFQARRVEKLATLPGVDAVVVDPPRAGLGAQVVDLIGASNCPRLVYVSCDAATFARDATLLASHGFVLRDAQAFDLFPLTAHVELVGTFDR